MGVGEATHQCISSRFSVAKGDFDLQPRVSACDVVPKPCWVSVMLVDAVHSDHCRRWKAVRDHGIDRQIAVSLKVTGKKNIDT